MYEEVDLLRELHWHCRGMNRYNGVDGIMFGEKYHEMIRVMHLINNLDFDDDLDDEDEDDE